VKGLEIDKQLIEKRGRQVDMSSKAVTARLKRACGLGDAERLATMIRSAIAEIESGRPTSDEKDAEKKTRNVPHARIHS
jgi:hypothetical protein